MKVTEKKIDDEHVLLDAEASPAEVNHVFNMAYNLYAQQMGWEQVPGKTVPELAKERQGIDDLDEIVAPVAIDFLVPFAIDKSGIMPAFTSKAEEGATIKHDEPCSFQTAIMPKPEYELTSYDPVTITIPPLNFDDVADQSEIYIARIADNYATFEDIEPHPVGDNDSFLLALEASCDGKRLDGLSTDGRTYIMGMGFMPDDFEAQLMGMNVGETKSFSFELPGAGQNGNPGTVDCTVTVKQMQRKIPAVIDDAWVQKNMPAFKDAADLHSDLEQRIKEEKKNQHEVLKLQTAASELAKRFNGHIGEEVFNFTQRSLLDNLEDALARRGMSLDKYVQEQGERPFELSLMTQVHDTLAQGYALDALFRHENLEIDEDDLNEAAASMSPSNPAEIRRSIEEDGRGFALRELAQRIKANHWLVEHANIIEQAPEE